MPRNFNSRLRKIERITKPKPPGINTYEDFIFAMNRGEKIDIDASPYLRRHKKMLLQAYGSHIFTDNCKDEAQ